MIPHLVRLLWQWTSATNITCGVKITRFQKKLYQKGTVGRNHLDLSLNHRRRVLFHKCRRNWINNYREKWNEDSAQLTLLMAWKVLWKNTRGGLQFLNLHIICSICIYTCIYYTIWELYYRELYYTYRSYIIGPIFAVMYNFVVKLSDHFDRQNTTTKELTKMATNTKAL